MCYIRNILNQTNTTVYDVKSAIPTGYIHILTNGVNWTYYQYKITAANSLAISGGRGFIDELRLYPANAQTTTHTYEPFVGITGLCTPGNVVSRYEYDGFGRLKIIRDQDNNILKTFGYKYQQ